MQPLSTRCLMDILKNMFKLNWPVAPGYEDGWG
jgi:hypothetical protein